MRVKRNFDFDPADEYYLRILVNQGLSNKAIAKEISRRLGQNISETNVANTLHRLGWRRRSERTDELELPEGAEFIKDFDEWRGLAGPLTGKRQPDGWIQLGVKDEQETT